MTEGHQCGPEHDVDFFREIHAIFQKHPEASKKYSIASIEHELQLLKIDYRSTVQVAQIVGDEVILRKKTRDALTRDMVCCKWMTTETESEDGNTIVSSWICVQTCLDPLQTQAQHQTG